jgi:hypothetical protein
MKTIFLAAAALMAVGISSAAYAEGEGGGSGTADLWAARNGTASVPATEWFSATPAQREVLSHQYIVQPFVPPTNYAGQAPSRG